MLHATQNVYMRKYIVDLTASLSEMSEADMKTAIQKICKYLNYKYGQYNDSIDDDDDPSRPFETIRTHEYSICIDGQTLVCEHLDNDYGKLSLIVKSPRRLIALEELTGKDNHIAVCKALIEMVEGLHRWEHEMCSEWYE